MAQKMAQLRRTRRRKKNPIRWSSTIAFKFPSKQPKMAADSVGSGFSNSIKSFYEEEKIKWEKRKANKDRGDDEKILGTHIW